MSLCLYSALIVPSFSCLNKIEKKVNNMANLFKGRMVHLLKRNSDLPSKIMVEKKFPYQQQSLSISSIRNQKPMINHFKTYFVTGASSSPVTRKRGLCSTSGTNMELFGQYDIVVPGNISGIKSVPANIKRPDYYVTGKPRTYDSYAPEDRVISNPNQMSRLRAACQLAKVVLKYTAKHAKVGVTTEELDNLAHEFIINHGAYPSPLNYKGFPKSICTSVNNVAIHGIPDDRPLVDGDLLNIDVTVYLDGFHGDCSETVRIGSVDPAGVDLLNVGRQCLERGISKCGPGVPFSAIGKSIEDFADSQSVTVIPVITGHGIGQYFHGPPDIYHVAYPYPGVMQPGMTFTIEPVISQGGEDVITLKDGWTTVTKDNARTVQFEHTILVTSSGIEILTN